MRETVLARVLHLPLTACLLLIVMAGSSPGLARLASTHGVVEVFVCELDQRSGLCTPVGGVYVVVESPEEADNTIRVITGLDGRARFELVAAEGYALKTSARLYQPALVGAIEVKAQQVTELTIELQPDMGPVGSLRVLPPEGQDPRSLIGARVEVELIGEAVVWVYPLVRTGEGAFFQHLPAGRLYEVRVLRPGHPASQKEVVRVELGEVRTLAMALDASPAVQTAGP